MLGRLTRRGALRTVIGGLARGLFAASGMRRAEGTGTAMQLNHGIKPTTFEYEGCKVCRDNAAASADYYQVIINGGGSISRNEMRAYATQE